MDSNVSKLMAMASGKARNENDFACFSVADRASIDNALENIFLGKSLLIWQNGGKLVDAWNTALDSLRDEIFAIPNTSNAVLYLRHAVFAHRTQWATKMTSSSERSSIAYFKNDSERQALIENANNMINDGTNTIIAFIQKANSGAAHTETPQIVMEQKYVYDRENARVRKH